MNVSQVTAIAYPINSQPATKSPNNNLDTSNLENSFFYDHGNLASESLETSGNFFSQVC
jgi:hypothetical protein